MSATITDMRDFIVALNRCIPDLALRGSVGEYIDEMCANVDDPVAVYSLMRKICQHVVQELEFAAENAESVGYHRDAWRTRR
jgi:hypothetical protein